MEYTEKYLQAKWVTENPDGYDERDVVDAKRYCNAYLDGYNQALRIHDVVGRSEQLVCTFCDGTGGRVIYDTYLKCKKCNGSGAN
jgi:hypothetical protein